MSDDEREEVVRRAIGGSPAAVAWITARAATSDDPVIVAMDAILSAAPDRLDRARSVAVTSRDRQLVEIVRAHLGGDRELVDGLARDHLVDYPDSYVAAWVASGAMTSEPERADGRDE